MTVVERCCAVRGYVLRMRVGFGCRSGVDSSEVLGWGWAVGAICHASGLEGQGLGWLMKHPGGIEGQVWTSVSCALAGAEYRAIHPIAWPSHILLVGD